MKLVARILNTGGWRMDKFFLKIYNIFFRGKIYRIGDCRLLHCIKQPTLQNRQIGRQAHLFYPI